MRYVYPADDEFISLGHNSFAKISTDGGEALSLDASLLDLAKQCKGLHTLREHAENALCEMEVHASATSVERAAPSVRRVVNLGRSKLVGWLAQTSLVREVAREQLVARLQRCAEQGLLLSEGDLLRSTRGQASTRPVGVLAIPTAGADTKLQRAASSHLRALSIYGRDATLLIADDGSVSARNRELVSMLGASHRKRVRYCGANEKAAFAADLRKLGCPPDAVDFALFGDPDVRPGAGRNRNAILLATIGQRFVSVDDDSLPLAAGRTNSEDLAIEGDGLRSDIRFFANRSETMRNCLPHRVDVLGEHEWFLGASLQECLGQAARGTLTCESLGARLLRAIRRGCGRVRFTLSGVLGDCGFGVPRHLGLRGEAWRRLVSSAETYRTACRSREVLLRPQRATISDSSHCMGSGLGLDHTTLLPPFFPVLRNEDGLFGAILARIDRSGFGCQLPTALLHSPLPQRYFEPEDVVKAWIPVRLSEVVAACVRMSGPPGGEDPLAELKIVGEHLIGLSGSVATLAEQVRKDLLQRRAVFARTIETQLSDTGSRPSYWADDARRSIALMQAALQERDWDVPIDVLPAEDEAVRREATRRCVQSYGRLLTAWPDLVEATEALDRQERGIASCSVW